MNKVKFRRSARPGDRLTLQARITRRNGPFFFTEGQTLVEGQLIAQGEFSFALVDNSQAAET
jgi:3-hydroxymyristoyl/3-hydroxydecanoyl-(acyl carrier protein) dehydratase